MGCLKTFYTILYIKKLAFKNITKLLLQYILIIFFALLQLHIFFLSLSRKKEGKRREGKERREGEKNGAVCAGRSLVDMRSTSAADITSHSIREG